MEQGAYREEYSLDRYDDRERKPKKGGGGKKKGGKGGKKHGLILKSPALTRTAGRLSLTRGKRLDALVVGTAVLGTPILFLAGRRFIAGTGKRSATLIATGAAMQAPKSTRVAKVGKVMMIAGAVMGLFEGFTKLVSAPQAQGGGAA